MMLSKGSLVNVLGYKTPFVVVSCSDFHKKSDFVWVCPIVQGQDNYPLHVSLNQEQTVLCENIKFFKTNVVTDTKDKLSSFQMAKVQEIIEAILGIHDEN